jgi:hypothetical protein
VNLSIPTRTCSKQNIQLQNIACLIIFVCFTPKTNPLFIILLLFPQLYLTSKLPLAVRIVGTDWRPWHLLKLWAPPPPSITVVSPTNSNTQFLFFLLLSSPLYSCLKGINQYTLVFALLVLSGVVTCGPHFMQHITVACNTLSMMCWYSWDWVDTSGVTCPPSNTQFQFLCLQHGHRFRMRTHSIGGWMN